MLSQLTEQACMCSATGSSVTVGYMMPYVWMRPWR